MNIVGIIAEYNPFHYGHKYQIEHTKKQLNASHIVIVMSGYFVQRGFPAIIDPYRRAQMAILNGADLVIQLPTMYSLQSAEGFSNGAIRLLNQIPSVQFLSFGSECADLKLLKEMAEKTRPESVPYQTAIKKDIENGHSYGAANQRYLKSLFNRSTLYSNDVLALEYLRALENTNIKPYAIKRIGQAYHECGDPEKEYTSATSIRHSIDKVLKSSTSLPTPVHRLLMEAKEEQNGFTMLEPYLVLLKYLLFIKNTNYKDIVGYENGITELLMKHLLKENDWDSFIDQCRSRRYSPSRLRRFIFNALLSIEKEDLDNISSMNLPFFPLAFNSKGQEILRSIRDLTPYSIVSKFSDHYKNHPNRLLDIEHRATDLFYLQFHPFTPNKIFTKSPMQIKR